METGSIAVRRNCITIKDLRQRGKAFVNPKRFKMKPLRLLSSLNHTPVEPTYHGTVFLFFAKAFGHNLAGKEKNGQTSMCLFDVTASADPPFAANHRGCSIGTVAETVP